jgi:hypothetical protein
MGAFLFYINKFMDKNTLNRLQSLFFYSTEEQYLDYLNFIRNETLNANVPFYQPETNFLSPEKYKILLLDSGSGPISSGLKQLQYASSILSGATATGLSHFNNLKPGLVNRVQTASDAQLLTVIIEEVQMADHFSYGFDKKCPEIQNFLRIVKDISLYLDVGKLKASDFNQQLLTSCKKIIEYNISVG